MPSPRVAPNNTSGSESEEGSDHVKPLRRISPEELGSSLAELSKRKMSLAELDASTESGSHHDRASSFKQTSSATSQNGKSAHAESTAGTTATMATRAHHSNVMRRNSFSGTQRILVPPYRAPPPTADSGPVSRAFHRAGYSLCWLLAALRLWLTAGQPIASCNVVASVAFLFLVPYQAAFDAHAAFGPLYALGYALDLAVVLHRLIAVATTTPALWALAAAARDVVWKCDSRRASVEEGESAATAMATLPADVAKPSIPSRALKATGDAVRRSRRRARVERMLSAAAVAKLALSLPVDALLWGSAAQRSIPYVRLSRLLLAPLVVHNFLTSLERSQGMAFSVSRAVRVVGVFVTASHGLCCTFHVFAHRTDAKHYQAAPWKPATHASAGVQYDASAWPLYLRSLYWSLYAATYTPPHLLRHPPRRAWAMRGLARAPRALQLASAPRYTLRTDVPFRSLSPRSCLALARLASRGQHDSDDDRARRHHRLAAAGGARLGGGGRAADHVRLDLHLHLRQRQLHLDHAAAQHAHGQLPHAPQGGR